MLVLDAARHAARTVRRSKRMLVAVGLVDLIVCLPPAAFLALEVHSAAARRTDALEVARRFDPDFFADLRQRLPGLDADLTALVAASLVLFFLVRPIVLGGFVGASATERRLHFGAFVRDGGTLYWKFLRIALVAVVACWLASVAAKPLITQVDEWASQRSEATAQRYRLVTQLCVFGAFSVVATVVEYARIGMRLNRRPGVLRELGRSTLFVLQHPGRTLGFFLFALALEAGVLAAFGWLVRILDGGYYATTAILLVGVQGVVTLREAARLFHVAGAWHIRAAEAGEEPREAAEVVPEPPESDVLRSPLPWNVR